MRRFEVERLPVTLSRRLRVISAGRGQIGLSGYEDGPVSPTPWVDQLKGVSPPRTLAIQVDLSINGSELKLNDKTYQRR